MKVIHINAHGKFSTGNIASGLAKETGEGSKLFYTRDRVSPELGIKFFTKTGFYLDLFLTRLTGRDGIWSFGNTRRILRALKKEKPDLIHLHNLHGFYINYKMLFSFLKKNDIKVVWTLHDTWAFTGHCAHFDYVGCQKWQSGCGSCPLNKQTYLKSWFFDRSRANFKSKKKSFTGLKDLTIVTPSAWLKDLVGESFLKKYKVQVIHNGIPTELFSRRLEKPKSFLLPEDKKIVLAVASSWDEMKGFSDLVALSKKLPKEYQLVMVGLKEWQKEALAGENILAITKTENREELADLYAKANVFVNTTYQDTFPTVNLEALCSGTPVITYATGGSVETVNETNGRVVSKGDVDALTKEILALEKKDFNREEISHSAKEKYSKEKMI